MRVHRDASWKSMPTVRASPLTDCGRCHGGTVADTDRPSGRALTLLSAINGCQSLVVLDVLSGSLHSSRSLDALPLIYATRASAKDSVYPVVVIRFGFSFPLCSSASQLAQIFSVLVEALPHCPSFQLRVQTSCGNAIRSATPTRTAAVD